MKLVMKLRYALRQTSMLASSEVLQAERVLPFLPGLTHLMSRIPGMAQESYWELTSSMFPVNEVKMVYMNMHLYSSSCLKRLQTGLGVFSSTLETLKRVFMPTSTLQLPVSGDATLINTPESGTATIALGLASNPLTQLFQRQVAMAPADEPVKTTFSALAKLYLSMRYLKWERVLQAPLINNQASLYLMLFQLLPWWKEPSQYQITTLVQLANLLFQGSVDKYPPFMVICSFRFLLLPRSVLLRWQQFSITSEMLAPMQEPPPLKKMMNLLGSLPWWMQRAGGEPSRHLALGSVLWITFLKGCSAARMAGSRQSSKTYDFIIDCLYQRRFTIAYGRIWVINCLNNENLDEFACLKSTRVGNLRSEDLTRKLVFGQRFI